MGDIVRFPNCREIAPEVSLFIEKRTREASYWVKRWSEINRRLYEVGTNGMDEAVLEDASLYVLGWLYERNHSAIKARGF